MWLTANLQGDENKEVRESLKEYGFDFARRQGGHPLPGGKVGPWGRSCTKPVPFKHQGGKTKSNQPRPKKEFRGARADGEHHCVDLLDEQQRDEGEGIPTELEAAAFFARL